MKKTGWGSVPNFSNSSKIACLKCTLFTFQSNKVWLLVAVVDEDSTKGAQGRNRELPESVFKETK